MNVFIKMTFPNGTTRRVAVARASTVKDLKAKAIALWGEADLAADAPKDVTLQYQDADGDLIWVVTDAELVEYLAASEAANKSPKFTVRAAPESKAEPAPESKAESKAEPAPEAQAQAEPEPEPEPEDPLVVLARALSNPSTVQLLQAQLASSPAVTDAVVSVANSFVEGGPVRASLAAMEAVPAVKAAAMEAVKQDPALHEAVQNVMDHVESGESAFPHPPFAPWMFFAGPGSGPHHGGFHGRPWHPHPHGPHPHAHPHPHGPHPGAGVHPFVFCDACSASDELKTKSKLAGNISFRGWIAGPRFRSKAVHDFDLCESCFNASGFVETHGPFERIEPRVSGLCGPASGQAQPGGGGCGRWRQPHPGQGPFQGQGHPHRGPWGGPWAGAGQGGPAGAWGGCRPGGPRGCRGSGRRGFADAVAETLGRCAEAVNEVVDESSELAQIARAIQESLKVQAQQPGVGIEKQEPKPASQAKAASDAKPVSEAKPTSEAKPVSEPQAQAQVQAQVQAQAQQPQSEDEWVVEDASADPMIKWREELQRLHALGFTDSHEYVEFLEEEKGDLERVINRILRRRA